MLTDDDVATGLHSDTSIIYIYSASPSNGQTEVETFSHSALLPRIIEEEPDCEGIDSCFGIAEL